MQTILAHFPGARQKSADKWQATCPACGKRNKVQITEGKFRAFVKCWSGCTEEAITVAAGLQSLCLARTEAPAERHNIPAPMPARALTNAHRAELQASGISDAIINHMGVWSESDPAVLRSLGFSAGQSRCVPCMVFPCHTPDGRTLYQIKPDMPFRDEGGKPVKYLTPAGGDYDIGILPHRREDLTDVTIPLWVTEGAKKAAAAETQGLLTIWLTGVWMWQKKGADGRYCARPGWHHVALNGRTVYIAFDSDAMQKRSVYEALSALYGYLHDQGALVQIVYLPNHNDDEKIGMDDFLVAGHSVEDMIRLADTTLHPIAPDFTQQVVKAIQKGLRGKNAVVSATGVKFEQLDKHALRDVGQSVRNVVSQTQRPTFWIWGELWIAAKQLVPHGELQTSFAKWFGQDNVRRASEAASIARKFPEDKFNRLLPPWVFQQIVGADAETQQILLDTYEADGLTRDEIRAYVRLSKGLDGHTPRRAGEEPLREGIAPLLRRIKEIVPIDNLPRWIRYLEKEGTDAFDAIVDRWEEAQHLTGKNPAGGVFETSFRDINEDDLVCLPRGKYQGYALVDIPDEAYLNWLAEQVPASLRPLIEQELECRIAAHLVEHTAATSALVGPDIAPNTPPVYGESRAIQIRLLCPAVIAAEPPQSSSCPEPSLPDCALLISQPIESPQPDAGLPCGDLIAALDAHKLPDSYIVLNEETRSSTTKFSVYVSHLLRRYREGDGRALADLMEARDAWHRWRCEQSVRDGPTDVEGLQSEFYPRRETGCNTPPRSPTAADTERGT